MEEIAELVEYSEFLDFASEAVVDFVDDLNENDSFDEQLDYENVNDVIDNELFAEVDKVDTDIIECIINMIELEYILQEHGPKERRKSEKRWGVHPINQMRREQGHFNNLFQEMMVHDHEKFFNYTRMTPERFEHLFEIIETSITKEAPNAIPAKCRLLLTLRFLASGDSLKSLHYNFRVEVSTAHYIISETCEVLWDVLQPIYLKFPEKEDWLKIEKDFREKLNLPNCVGANLLAICDAHKNFIYVEIGSYGQQTDGGILFNSTFGKRLDMKKLNFPEPANLPHTNITFPFFVIGDSAFPLKENLLTPYAADHLNLSDIEANFNSEQCSVRKIIENTFAILVRRWQVFSGPIESHPTSVDKILKAAIVLHNYIKSFDDLASIRYMREERNTHSTTESLCSFYDSGLRLKTANENEYASVARDTYANYLMNVL